MCLTSQTYRHQFTYKTIKEIVRELLTLVETCAPAKLACLPFSFLSLRFLGLTGRCSSPKKLRSKNIVIMQLKSGATTLWGAECECCLKCLSRHNPCQETIINRFLVRLSALLRCVGLRFSFHNYRVHATRMSGVPF